MQAFALLFLPVFSLYYPYTSILFYSHTHTRTFAFLLRPSFLSNSNPASQPLLFSLFFVVVVLLLLI